MDEIRKLRDQHCVLSCPPRMRLTPPCESEYSSGGYIIGHSRRAEVKRHVSVERAAFWHCTFNRLHGQLRIGQFSATIILIMSTHLPTHGAWHGNWCWLKVVPLLDADGHRVLGPDLPEHGDDRTATKTVTLTKLVTVPVAASTKLEKSKNDCGGVL
jgi:hypothetical protein